MTILSKTTFMAVAFTATLFLTSAPIANAGPTQTVSTEVQAEAVNVTKQFTNKRYKISGDWKIVTENGQTIIRFSDDFKTKKGPDLKVFLSPKSINSVDGETATIGSIKLGELKSIKGSQDYIIPDSLTLADFSSVLIHCEAYSVLWGGGDL